MRVDILMIAVPAFALAVPLDQLGVSDTLLLFPATNHTYFFNLTQPGIRCFEEEPTLKSTTVDSCRPALTEMRNFQDYSRTQTFREHKYPKKPLTPPIAWQARGATCDIRLGSGDPTVEDKISWKDIRTAVTNIVEDCQPPRGEGKGGWIVVGQKGEFVLRVLGRDPVEVDDDLVL
ncbi:uncharacterized protein KY384_008158 [Bacidia gigantensis]|uniref:uncharacterized protein n=1 Tax=Bacidia gigantensis TaxID=2732470 RepID=UPI001D04AF0E|nr:uncharacterized protein KY384_008158 [Bacidia gigantensis]KAG8526729.1 hypothetical protein KY384_008158 [Bacidia gigantensis]